MNVTFEDEQEFMQYVKYENTTQLRLSLDKITDIVIIKRLFDVSLRKLKQYSFKTLYMSRPFAAPDTPITTITSALINYKYKDTEKYYEMTCSAREIVKFLSEYNLINNDDLIVAEEMASYEDFHGMDNIFKTILH